MIIFRLITLQSAVWAVSAATSLINQLLNRFDEAAPDDYQDRALLSQCITMLRIFSNFISDEQLSEINENPLEDIEDFTSLNILADVASRDFMEDNI